MPGRFLLDTNIVIALLNGEPMMMEWLEKVDEAFLSTIVLGELFYGAHKSSRVSENIARVADLAAHIAVLAVDSDTANRYGIIKSKLH